MLYAQDRIGLNRVAQGLAPIPDAMDWFSRRSDQVDVLRELWQMAAQAGCTRDDVLPAIQFAQLRASFTACVLMNNGDLSTQAMKVLALPKAERTKAFRLFMALLHIADSRRQRTRCKDDCTHWWHRDLANEDVVRDLLRCGIAGTSAPSSRLQ